MFTMEVAWMLILVGAVFVYAVMIIPGAVCDWMTKRAYAQHYRKGGLR